MIKWIFWWENFTSNARFKCTSTRFSMVWACTIFTFWHLFLTSRWRWKFWNSSHIHRITLALYLLWVLQRATTYDRTTEPLRKSVNSLIPRLSSNQRRPSRQYTLEPSFERGREKDPFSRTLELPGKKRG